MESVRVAPGMSPPSMSTTPNSPTVCRKLSTTAASSERRASGTRMLEDEPHGTGAQKPRSIDEGSVDGCEAGDQRLHGKGQAVNDRADDQAIEGKGQWMAEQGGDAAAKGGARAEQDEKKKTEHGGRQNHGQRGQSFKSGSQRPRPSTSSAARGTATASRITVVTVASRSVSANACQSMSFSQQTIVERVVS